MKFLWEQKPLLGVSNSILFVLALKFQFESSSALRSIPHESVSLVSSQSRISESLQRCGRKKQKMALGCDVYQIHEGLDFREDCKIESMSLSDPVAARLKRNEFFRRDYLELAIAAYNDSICKAVFGTEEMALANANRSACYFKLARFAMCLSEIELAKKSNYPQRRPLTNSTRIDSTISETRIFSIFRTESQIWRIEHKKQLAILTSAMAFLMCILPHISMPRLESCEPGRWKLLTRPNVCRLYVHDSIVFKVIWPIKKVKRRWWAICSLASTCYDANSFVSLFQILQWHRNATNLAQRYFKHVLLFWVRMRRMQSGLSAV